MAVHAYTECFSYCRTIKYIDDIYTNNMWERISDMQTMEISIERHENGGCLSTECKIK